MVRESHKRVASKVLFVKKDKKRAKQTPAENLFDLKQKNLILEEKLLVMKIKYKNLQNRLIKCYLRESKLKNINSRHKTNFIFNLQKT